MKKKAVLFDLDNTLVDREPTAKILYRKQVQMTFPDDPKKQEEMYNYLFSVDGQGRNHYLSRYQAVRDHFGFSEDWVFEAADYWLTNYAEYTVAFPGTIEVLKEVKKNYRIGLISDGVLELQQAKIDAIGIRDLFEMTLVTSEISKEKPNPVVFEEGLRRMGDLKGEECYYVGDNAWKDMAGCYRMGMTGIHICAHGETPSPGFLSITDIRQLPEVLKQEEMK